MDTNIDDVMDDLCRRGSTHGRPPRPFAAWAADALIAAMVVGRPATAWKLRGGYYARLTDWPRTTREHQLLDDAMSRLMEPSSADVDPRGHEAR